MHGIEWRTVYVLMRWLFWCLLPKFQSNQDNKYQNNSGVNAWIVGHESAYIILFLAWHNESINDDKNKDLPTSTPCVSLGQFKFCWWYRNHCWWRHKCIIQYNNCDACMWKLISNSLDIDYIHGHLCEKKFKKPSKFGITSLMHGLRW